MVLFARSLIGGGEEPGYLTVGATAVKRGDPVKAGASAAVHIPITAAADVVVGVVQSDAAIGATVAYDRATLWNVFIVPCSAAKKYVDASDRFTTCDFDTFTSGSMSIDPATDTSHSVLMLGLADKEANDTNGNKTLSIFQLRAYK